MMSLVTITQAVTWRVLAGICCIFPALSIILLFFIPESPAWLVTQGESLTPMSSWEHPRPHVARQTRGGQEVTPVD